MGKIWAEEPAVRSTMPYVPDIPEHFYIAEPGGLVSAPSSRFENVRGGIDGIVPLSYSVWVKHMNERFAFNANSILARTKLCFPQILVLRKNSGGKRRCHWFVRFGLITPSINIHERMGSSFLFELSAQSATRVLDSCVATGCAFDSSNPFSSSRAWLASGHDFCSADWAECSSVEVVPKYLDRLFAMAFRPAEQRDALPLWLQRPCSPSPSPCLTDARTPPLETRTARRTQRVFGDSLLDLLPAELSGAILRSVFRELCTSGEFGDFVQALQLRTVSRTFSDAFSAVARELQSEMLGMLSTAHSTKRAQDVFAAREQCLDLHFCPIGVSCETRKNPTHALLRLKSGKPPLLRVGARIEVRET